MTRVRSRAIGFVMRNGEGVPETTIIIPCYNEADRLDTETFARFAAEANDIQLLFVNDGSSDGTAEVLSRLCAENPQRLGFMALEQNSGKAEAVRRGIVSAMEADPGFVGFWDADLATSLEDIAPFREVLCERTELQAVFGSRVNLLGRSVHRNLMRHYVGRAFATAATAVLRVPIYDTQCGAKLFRVTDDVRETFAEPFISRWIFDVELVARLRTLAVGRGQRDMNSVIFEQPLMVWRDVAGSKLRLRHFVTVALDLIRILIKYPHA